MCAHPFGLHAGVPQEEYPIDFLLLETPYPPDGGIVLGGGVLGRHRMGSDAEKSVLKFCAVEGETEEISVGQGGAPRDSDSGWSRLGERPPD
jgi:hypothetical protein